MSKPAEKIVRPESYSPKKRPEILNLMEDAGKNRMAHETKTANGGSYISGVPYLKWGEWRDCSYAGALLLIFDAIGVETTYEDIMGYSGACWKIVMNDGHGPESQMLQVGVNCDTNVTRALGIDMYSISDDSERDVNVTANLDKGYPVLACGQRDAPEWTVITGYERNADGVKFFGRSYFDGGSNPNQPLAGDIFTENEYLHANQYPGQYPSALMRFFDRKCEAIDRKGALKVSLETCANAFSQPPSHYMQGFDGYDVLISGLEASDDEYLEFNVNDRYHIGSLMDARRAAHIFLGNNGDTLTGANKANLMTAAGLYKSMLDNMLSAVPYAQTSESFSTGTTSTWSAHERSALSSALRQNKELEREAQALIKAILNRWDD